MRNILILLASLILASCGTVNATVNPDGSLTWKSTTLFKDIVEVNAESSADDFKFGLGSSTGNLSEAQMKAVLCIMTGDCE